MGGDVQRVDTGIPQHDERRYIFSVTDETGLPLDITAADEITWIVARNVHSTPMLTKTLTGGSIQLTGPNKFYFTITSAEADLPSGCHYHEARLVTATGLPRTVCAGAFLVTDTRIGDA